MDGGYIGSEISKKRISVAEDWIKKERLDEKNYKLYLSKDNNLFVAPLNLKELVI